MTLPMSTSARPMKIEFLLCGSPNDAFYSQTAMFRMALDSLGGIYRQARLSLCIGDETFQAVPARWREPLRNVDVLWAPREMFRDIGNGGDFGDAGVFSGAIAGHAAAGAHRARGLAADG